jgi:hypothetical protein
MILVSTDHPYLGVGCHMEAPHMEGMCRYQLFFVNYCQFITLKFIADMLWATELWTMAVMPHGILPPLPHSLLHLVHPAIV